MNYEDHLVKNIIEETGFKMPEPTGMESFLLTHLASIVLVIGLSFLIIERVYTHLGLNKSALFIEKIPLKETILKVLRLVLVGVVVTPLIFFLEVKVDTPTTKEKLDQLTSKYGVLQEAFPNESYKAGACAITDNKHKQHPISLSDDWVTTLYTPELYDNDIVNKIVENVDGKYSDVKKLQADLLEEYPWLYVSTTLGAQEACFS